MSNEQFTQTEDEEPVLYTEDIDEEFHEYIQLASDCKVLGNQFFNDGNNQKAIEKYVECVNTLDALLRVVACSESSLSEKTFTQIEELKTITKTNIAHALLNQGDLTRALESVNDAIRLNGDYSRALYTRAKIYLLQGNNIRARNDVNSVLKLQPNSREALMLKESIETMLVLGA
jgi:tetratricopeptide (TPR) repeat protein